MKRLLYFFIAIAFITSGCSSPKNLGIHKQRAEAAEAKKNFSAAVEAWELYFREQNEAENEVEGKIFARAAKTAFKANREELAVDWFDQARYRGHADREMYSILAEIFRKQGNLSKELSALKFYTENFETDNPNVNRRLFALYFEINETDKALDVWKMLPEEEKKIEQNLDKFFQLNKQMENEEICDSVSLVLLKIAPEHTDALEWNAEKFYWKAENRYQREMEKYENNKTTSQYRKLLKELDIATDDFKKALGYFKKLWEQNPDKKYAGYLANIHARFNEKEKSEYYRKFLD